MWKRQKYIFPNLWSNRLDHRAPAKTKLHAILSLNEKLLLCGMIWQPSDNWNTTTAAEKGNNWFIVRYWLLQPSWVLINKCQRGVLMYFELRNAADRNEAHNGRNTVKLIWRWIAFLVISLSLSSKSSSWMRYIWGRKKCSLNKTEKKETLSLEVCGCQ